MTGERKRRKGVSFLLIYAFLVGVMFPWGSEASVSAAGNGLLSGMAGERAMSSGYAASVEGGRTATRNAVAATGAAVSGSGVSGAAVSGSGVSGAVVVTGAGVTVSGSVTTALFGVPYEFQIGDDGAPLSFSLFTSTRSDLFHQVRIITTEAEGFTVRLFDASKNFLQGEAGVGGNRVWRQEWNPKMSYYLVVSGKPSAKGTLLLSEIIDDYGDTFSAANAISLNKGYSVETELAGEIDVLAFTTAKAEAKYSIRIGNISGSGGTYGLYDKNGKLVSQYQGEVGTKGVSISPKLAVGAKYYLRLTSEQTGRKFLVTVAASTRYYKVTYQLNGGKNAKGNPTSYISTTKKKKWKNPAKKGYVFGGWYLDSRLRTRSYNLYGSFKRDLRLYARWIRAAAPKVSLKSAKSTKKKQMAVTWKKQSGAKGYQVVYGTSKALKKGVKRKSTTKTSVTLKRLKAGEKYYVMMRSYVKDSAGKKVYGAYSAKKKVKIRATDKAAVKKKTVTKKKVATKKKTATEKKAATKKKAAVKKKATTKKKTTAQKKAVAKKTTTKKSTTKKKTTTKKTVAKKKATR